MLNARFIFWKSQFFTIRYCLLLFRRFLYVVNDKWWLKIVVFQCDLFELELQFFWHFIYFAYQTAKGRNRKTGIKNLKLLRFNPLFKNHYKEMNNAISLWVSINVVVCAYKYPFHTQYDHYIVENARQYKLILLTLFVVIRRKICSLLSVSSAQWKYWFSVVKSIWNRFYVFISFGCRIRNSTVPLIVSAVLS